MKNLTMTMISATTAVAVAACGNLTPAQQASVDSGVQVALTVEQEACVAANSGLFGTSTEVQDVVKACGFAQALVPVVQQIAPVVSKIKFAKAAQLPH